MVISRKSPVSVLVVLAGLPAMVLLVQPPARAQFPTGQNGHALDASNRVGSGGYNDPMPHPNYNQINNDIIYGNVSGLNGFQGKINTFSPNVFQGQVGSGPSDSLNAIAAPVDYTRRNTGQPNYTPYYSTSNYVPPASNFNSPLANNGLTSNSTLVNGGSGITPAPYVSPLLPTQYDSRLELQNLDPMKGNLPAPGELNVAGPVDPSGNASMYSMSPLYGVKPLDTSAQANSANSLFMDQQSNSLIPSHADRSRLTPAAIQQMREELNKTVLPGELPPTETNTPTPQGGPGAQGSEAGTVPNGTISSGSISQVQPIGAAPLSTGALSAQTFNDNMASAQAASGGLGTGESLQNSLVIPASKQSKQLKALEQKFAKDTQKLNDVEAANRLNRELQAQKAGTNAAGKTGGAANGAGGSSGGAGNPGLAAGGAGMGPGMGLPSGPANVGTPSSGTPAPKPELKPILNPPDNSADNQSYVVTSLATGIQAKGLADLMKSAETQMRQGKFTEAVDSYEAAQAVAPNNPFVYLGRSFAELGASYYGKADADLNRAVASDPAVLSGKYDLNGFLGDDRVKFVKTDLADIAKNEKGARPLVLLAFIAHNTGDDSTAAKYLDDAAARGGGYGSLITLMQAAWGIKGAKG